MSLRSPEKMMTHTQPAEMSEWSQLTEKERVQWLRKGAYTGMDVLYVDGRLATS